MVTVVETWRLKPEFADKAEQIMQDMDDLVGPPAHASAGWAGHAHFYQAKVDTTTCLMIYPWSSVADHQTLAANEEGLLRTFIERYCSQPREIAYFTELEVDVEHDH